MNDVPAVFFLSGLNETSRMHRSALLFLALTCYCIIVLLNASLIALVVSDVSLREPMYILLCAFSLNGLYGTSCFYPKLLWDLLSGIHVISYAGCLLQALAMHSVSCCDVSILTLMAYDRFLAICRPLRYRSLVSKRRAVQLALLSWFLPFCLLGINLFLTSRLKLCGSRIDKLFCVNWSIVSLACFPEKTSINSIVANVTIVVYALHVLVILCSYLYILQTCAKSLENRVKFTQTCAPHLTCLLIYAATVLTDIMSTRLGSRRLPVSFRNFVAVQFLVIPPLLNPIVYGFKLTKVRSRIIRFVFCKTKSKS